MLAISFRSWLGYLSEVFAVAAFWLTLACISQNFMKKELQEQ